jgi:hypothetical protein
VEGNYASLPIHMLLSSMESRDGSQVRVGEDAIMGCGRDIFLPDEKHTTPIGNRNMCT